MGWDKVSGNNDEYKDAPVLKLTKSGDSFEGTVLEISRQFPGQYGDLRVLVLRGEDGNVFKVFASKILLDRINEADPRPGDKLKGEREDRTGKESGRMYVSANVWIDRQSAGPDNASYTVPVTPRTAPPAEQKSFSAEPPKPVADDAPPF